jgi:hypothetical protein
MKKNVTTTFCILMLCSLILSIGTVMAAEPGYERISYLTTVIPTIDGQWTTENEWTDGEDTWIGTDVFFTSTQDGDMTRWIVEFLTDTTNDPGDMWRFCINTGQSFSWKFEIYGHTDLVWYIGSADWTEREEAFPIEWEDSLSTSPTSTTPHWILEFQIDKTDQFEFPDVWYFLLQVNDASNPTFLAWPPTDPENSDSWGTENFSTEAIPEGLTFAVMVLLTTVSMLVSYKYLVKRKETKTQ